VTRHLNASDCCHCYYWNDSIYLIHWIGYSWKMPMKMTTHYDFWIGLSAAPRYESDFVNDCDCFYCFVAVDDVD
jgi:hypothetical protein